MKTLQELKDIYDRTRDIVYITDGAWIVKDNMVWNSIGDSIVSYHEEEKRAYIELDVCEFIAAAREALPALIEEVELLREALSKADSRLWATIHQEIEFNAKEGRREIKEALAQSKDRLP